MCAIGCLRKLRPLLRRSADEPSVVRAVVLLRSWLHFARVPITQHGRACRELTSLFPSKAATRTLVVFMGSHPVTRAGGSSDPPNARRSRPRCSRSSRPTGGLARATSTRDHHHVRRSRIPQTCRQVAQWHVPGRQRVSVRTGRRDVESPRGEQTVRYLPARGAKPLDLQSMDTNVWQGSTLARGLALFASRPATSGGKRVPADRSYARISPRSLNQGDPGSCAAVGGMHAGLMAPRPPEACH
jgi:hypothetical protein